MKQIEENINDYYNRGLQYYNNNEFTSSIEIFSNILNNHPNNPNLHYYLSVSYYHLQDYKGALSHIETTINFPNQDILLHRQHLIKIYIKLELYPKTMELLNQFISENDMLEYHILMCQLGIVDPQLDLNYQYYKKSTIKLINTNNAGLDVYYFLLLIAFKEYDYKLGLSTLSVVLKEIVSKKPNLQNYLEIVENKNYLQLEYRHIIINVFKEVSKLNLGIHILLHCPLFFDTIDDENNYYTIIYENINLLSNYLDTYDTIELLLLHFQIPFNLLYSNRTVPNAISNNFSLLFNKCCPSIEFTAPHLTNYSSKQQQELIKIGFISNQLHDTNGTLYYQLNNLIRYLPNNRYQVYLLLFTPFINDPKLDIHQIIILNNNLETNKSIISNI